MRTNPATIKQARRNMRWSLWQVDSIAIRRERHQQIEKIISRIEREEPELGPPPEYGGADMGVPQIKFTIRFDPIEANRGPPWVIKVVAANSATALEKAVHEMRYIYAQDPARFKKPSIDWAATKTLPTDV